LVCVHLRLKILKLKVLGVSPQYDFAARRSNHDPHRHWDSFLGVAESLQSTKDFQPQKGARIRKNEMFGSFAFGLGARSRHTTTQKDSTGLGYVVVADFCARFAPFAAKKIEMRLPAGGLLAPTLLVSRTASRRAHSHGWNA
jgi:hypothetical protein